MNTSHYTIKVECIENRIRIYLNENKVIEYEDVKNPLLNGGIGFGNTSKWYRISILSFRYSMINLLLFLEELPIIYSKEIESYMDSHARKDNEII